MYVAKIVQVSWILPGINHASYIGGFEASDTSRTLPKAQGRFTATRGACLGSMMRRFEYNIDPPQPTRLTQPHA
jgi:hypothetical protein